MALWDERTVDEETKIIESYQKNPCLCCRLQHIRNDDWCDEHCVGKSDHAGYIPRNLTYDWRNFRDEEAETYAKLIVRERKVTRHRFPLDNFYSDLIPDTAYEDISMEDLV